MLNPRPWRLVLLTHPTEFNKASNTGTLLTPALAEFADHQVQRLPWSRVAPDANLQAMDGYALLYPTAQAQVLDCDEPAVAPLPDHIHSVVLLDATWQLAQKMYNQSPYLQQMPALMLQSRQSSAYLLRRNQRQAGWCTAECAAMLLQKTGAAAAAAAVQQAFAAFNQRQTS
jgi:DTW domain-containing protein YfiP